LAGQRPAFGVFWIGEGLGSSGQTRISRSSPSWPGFSPCRCWAWPWPDEGPRPPRLAWEG